MKKRIASIVLAAITLAVLVGCGGQKKSVNATPKDIITALESYNNSEQMDANMKMEMQLKADNMEYKVGVEFNFQKDFSNYKTDYFLKGKAQLPLVGEMEMVSFYKDGYLYSDTMGEKTKEKVSAAAAKESFQPSQLSLALKEDFIENVKAEKSGDKTTYTYKLKEDKLKELFDSMDGFEKALPNSPFDGMGQANFKVKNTQNTIVVNSKGQVIQNKLDLELEATDKGKTASMHLIFEVNVNKLDNVIIQYPGDLSAYKEGSDLKID